jgi:ATP-dependent helicase/nuclease subunit A
MNAFLVRPLWALDAAERFEIGSEVSDILDDSAFAPLFGSAALAEVPLIGRIGDRILSGRLDRLVVTPTEVLAVDYKTNRRPPVSAAEIPSLYVRQMAAYRLALACLYPGRTVRCLLLWTDGPRLMEIPPACLDDILAGLVEPPPA